MTCLSSLDLVAFAGIVEATIHVINENFIQIIMPTGQSHYWEQVQSGVWCIM